MFRSVNCDPAEDECEVGKKNLLNPITFELAWIFSSVWVSAHPFVGPKQKEFVLVSQAIYTSVPYILIHIASSPFRLSSHFSTRLARGWGRIEKKETWKYNDEYKGANAMKCYGVSGLEVRWDRKWLWYTYAVVWLLRDDLVMIKEGKKDWRTEIENPASKSRNIRGLVLNAA